MIISTFSLPQTSRLADWKTAVEEANKLGERAHKAGIQLGFHNHNFEFATIDGKLVYDEIMSEFDPKLIKMQFQVAVVELGYNAADYFAKYPGVAAYLERTKTLARRQGYVETILGHRRYVPEVNASNRMVREAAERMAINMPVQGSSSDIIKVAMINLHRIVQERGLKSRMLLQVHDELIFEVPRDEMEAMQSLVRKTMSSAIAISVPLKVDVKSGSNWGAME